jgi:hypothetical protein
VAVDCSVGQTHRQGVYGCDGLPLVQQVFQGFDLNLADRHYFITPFGFMEKNEACSNTENVETAELTSEMALPVVDSSQYREYLDR